MIPYFQAGQAFLVAKGNPEGIKTVDDLCGKSVARRERHDRGRPPQRHRRLQAADGPEPSACARPARRRSRQDLHQGQRRACWHSQAGTGRGLLHRLAGRRLLHRTAARRKFEVVAGLILDRRQRRDQRRQGQHRAARRRQGRPRVDDRRRHVPPDPHEVGRPSRTPSPRPTRRSRQTRNADDDRACGTSRHPAGFAGRVPRSRCALGRRLLEPGKAPASTSTGHLPPGRSSPAAQGRSGGLWLTVVISVVAQVARGRPGRLRRARQDGRILPFRLVCQRLHLVLPRHAAARPDRVLLLRAAGDARICPAGLTSRSVRVRRSPARSRRAS